MTHTDYIVGVDEVGRGPLAGPVAVCAALVSRSFDFSLFPHLTDSKKMTEKRREAVFETALTLQREGALRFAVHFEPARVIDEIGIEAAIRRSLEKAVTSVGTETARARIFLDGRLHAPDQFSQETILGGDALVPVISLASVIAKVSRDRLMVEIAHEYPEYDFAKHKGYGTATHIQAIRTHGLSPEHRRSYTRRFAPLPEV